MAKKSTNQSEQQDSTERKPRAIRPAAERVAVYDAKIKFHKDAIEKLESLKAKALKPRGNSEKAQLKELLNKLKEKNMSLDELMKLAETQSE